MNINDIPPAPTPVKGGGGFGPLKFLKAVGLAVRSLWLHKLRSLLSVLGIVIGTSSVIALMAFGEGSMKDALDDIKRQGATNIVVRSVKPPDDSASSTNSKSMVAAYGLDSRDIARFQTFGKSITTMVPMRVFPSEARYLERMHNVRMIATTPDYSDVNKIQLARGRFFTVDDEENRINNCVLGAATADRLFPFEDAMGKTVFCRGDKYLVVGVASDRMPTGGTGGSQAAEDYNNDMYIPLSTANQYIGSKVSIRSAGSRSAEQVDIYQVTMTIDAEVDTKAGRQTVKAIGDQIKRLLEKHHDKKDWAVTIPLDRLEDAERQQERFTSLLVLIASISLLVGGIGIMNIMLATVTERTREIGIRRALGGKQRDITAQFLVEATVQTTIGGLIGVVVGLFLVFVVPVAPGAAAWLTQQTGLADTAAWLRTIKLPAQVNVPSIFLAVGVSVGVGVLFGWYPARRAAKLDPIEALRHTA
ncbi:ABC transporter permease [Limnoglobus roseus]|uniref:ABC transporter permease n=1 Tax=Limnoglobus roseus TaxID=2598579 RepID=A0A5C1A8L1_9BACT|nr:ABC transporter permease [Limnoglobus roseus]QEL14102.1 ABC transporter permease [Limnoglobus roseus]